MTLGHNFKKIRLDRNISVREVADYLNTSMKVIYNIEGSISEPNIEQLMLLSKLYKISIDELVKGK